jgi:hypothetical protein
VLLLAGTDARRAAAAPRLRALLERVSWPALVDELARQRLLPLLGGRIGAAFPAPPAFARAVDAETRAARAAGELGELLTLHAAAALEAAGVPAVPLKGPLLARALHGDAAMRASRDIDLLVEGGDLERGGDVLAALGWRPDPVAAPPVLHSRLVSDAGLPDVELHWRLHWYEAEFAAAALARAALGPSGIRRLRREDELAALLLFYARDGFAGLRHAIDAAAWWDANGAARDGVPVLDRVVAAHPALGRALTASAVVLDRLVGIPAAALVEAPGCLPWCSRRAVRLANPLMAGTPAQITAEVTLVDGLLAPGGGRRAFLRRRALPSEQQLPADLRGRPMAVARTAHVLRLLRRYALAIMRPRPGRRGDST